MKPYALMTVLACLDCGDAARQTPMHTQRVVSAPDAATQHADAGADARAMMEQEAARLAEAEASGRAVDAMATPLCDGDDRMELAYGTFGGGLTSGEEYLAWRNGIVGLFIDGHCRYYAAWLPNSHGKSGSLLGDVHTGELDPSTRDMLVAALRYSEWGLVAARARYAYSLPTASSMFDDGGNTLTDGNRVVHCIGACMDIRGMSLLPEATSLVNTAHQWAMDLYAKGTPMAGSVRVMATLWHTETTGPLPEGHAAQWPLSRPLQDFIHDPHVPGPRRYVDQTIDGADAQILRDLRSQQIGGAFTPWWYGNGPELPVVASPDGPLYSLVVSDLLPYEDEWAPGQAEGLHIWNQAFQAGP
jgi:hypothetical protein